MVAGENHAQPVRTGIMDGARRQRLCVGRRGAGISVRVLRGGTSGASFRQAKKRFYRKSDEDIDIAALAGRRR